MNSSCNQFYIEIKPNIGKKTSPVWNHFGHLFKKTDNKISFSDYVFCKHCLESNFDKPLSFVKKFTTNTSVGM